MHVLKQEEVLVKSKKTIEDYYACDICKSKIEKEAYKTSIRTAESVECTSYPESGWGETQTYDFCVKCWDEKVFPALKEMTGTSPRITDIDY